MAYLGKQQVLDIYKKLDKHEGEDFCYKRRVDAELVFSNGDSYRGVNGCSTDPCTRKGPDFCTRKDGIGDLEFLTCPSPCAETWIVIEAIRDGKDFEDFEDCDMITTGFPCKRCVSVIIDLKIPRLSFGNYKEEIPRVSDWYYLAQMTAVGVEANQIIKRPHLDEKKMYEAVRIKPAKHMEEFTLNKFRKSGWHYLQLLLDEVYRNEIIGITQSIEEQITYAPQSDGLVVKPIL